MEFLYHGLLWIFILIPIVILGIFLFGICVIYLFIINSVDSLAAKGDSDDEN